jgi:DNA-binding response OmpR family regulator
MIHYKGCPRLIQEEAVLASILIVDDQAGVRELIAQELINEGYSVAAVADAETAKAYVEDLKPDLVLLDLYLSGFEGWNVLNEIKNKDSLLPVLIVTAYDTYIDDPRVSQADGYFIKSFVHLDKLKRRIADILH